MKRSILHVWALSCGALLGACSGAEEAEAGPGGGPEAPVASSGGRASGQPGAPGDASDPRLLALIEAVDRGRLDRVETLLPRVEALGGVAVEIARARAALLLGRAVDALAKLEALRRDHPDRADVCATLAEVYAMLGEETSAEDVLREGLALDAKHPALERARGVYLLLQSGGASAALQHLELATLADPDLRYAGRPLAEARRLVARQAMADGDPERAEQHVLGALEFDPDDVGTRLLLADVRGALLDFDGAIELHEQLFSEGVGREQELALLHKRAAMASLLGDDREGAIEHFLRARELGLDPDLLGWGAQALRDEAEARLEEGLDRFDAGDLEGSLAALERARTLDPDSLEIPHKLGAVLFRAERFADAAAIWRDVLQRSLAEGRVLPVPVHLDLARARRMSGDAAGARETLEAYLERAPEGAFAEPTREMLERLGD